MRFLYGLTAALTGLLLIGAPAAAEAKPARTQPDPQVFDLSDPSDLARPAPKTPTQEACYIEPSGFHSQIRWDAECRRTRAMNSQSSGGNSEGKYNAPKGSKSQIRWD